MIGRPTDVDEAFEQWGCNCGPAALAAALGRECADVRPLVDPFKGYMNATDMLIALHRADIRARTLSKPSRSFLEERGVIRIVLVQWNGSWDTVPRAAATRRHWVASVATDAASLVYDVNEDGWITLDGWVASTVPQLLPKRATGWSIAWAAEVTS